MGNQCNADKIGVIDSYLQVPERSQQLHFALAADKREKTEKHHNKVNCNNLGELLQKHGSPFGNYSVIRRVLLRKLTEMIKT